MNLKQEFPKGLKIIVAGDGGIGKTTLVKCFCYRKFHKNQKLTVGMDFYSKEVIINGKIEMLNIWDLGGQETYRKIIKDYPENAKGAILGFELPRIATFYNLIKWLDLLKKSNEEFPIILVGTKIDLEYHSLNVPDMAKNFIIEHNLIDYIEVSSKNFYNIDLPFKILLSKVKECPIESIKIN